MNTQKHLDEIENRIKKALQMSADESITSCADPKSSTEPTIETKEVSVEPTAGAAIPEPTFSAPMTHKAHKSCGGPGGNWCSKYNFKSEADARIACIALPECTMISSPKVGVYYLTPGSIPSNIGTYPGWEAWTITRPTAPVAMKYTKTTIVGCDQKSSCGLETVEKELIFDDKINCIITKQDNIKSEKSIIVEQEECITKAKSKKETLVESIIYTEKFEPEKIEL